MRTPKEVLFIDTETTGLNPQQNKLLSVGLVAWKNGLVVNPQEILVWDEDDKTVDPEAMAVNKIDLDSHRELAIPSSEVFTVIDSYIRQNLTTRGRIVLGGHNTGFDVNFIKEAIGLKNFDDRFMHRTVDTSVILRFLYHVGLVNHDIGSLENALKFFGFTEQQMEGSHTAKVDALNTAKLYNALLRKVSNACRK